MWSVHRTLPSEKTELTMSMDLDALCLMESIS